MCLPHTPRGYHPTMSVLAITLSYTCAAPLPTVRFERVHERLSFSSPVQVVAAPDRDDAVYVVEQRGRVRRVSLAHDAQEKELVLDIKDRVQLRHSEEGLLSIAFVTNSVPVPLSALGKT